MRYKLDQYGYVSAVSFGCYLNNCTEYTGEIPTGYNSLVEWAENDYVNAYYIDKNGNLVLDVERKENLKNQAIQDAKNNAPLTRKDLFETNEELESQYKKATVSGGIVVVENPKTMFHPYVKVSGLTPENKKIVIHTYGRNFLDLGQERKETSNGITYLVDSSGKLGYSGKATDTTIFSLTGNMENTIPIFTLKAGVQYVYSGSLNEYTTIELWYYDGETSQQKYVIQSRTFTLAEDIKVTNVVMRHAVINATISYGYKYIGLYLNESESPGIRATHKELVIDFSDNEFITDTSTLGDLIVEDGKITLVIDGVTRTIGEGTVGLFEGYNSVHCTDGTSIEVTYTTKEIDVDSLAFLQGKSTTTNKFKILEDGSIEAHNGFFSGNLETNNIAVKDGGWLSIGDGLLMSASGGVQGVSSQFGMYVTSEYTFCTRDGGFSVYNGDDNLYHLSTDGSGFFGGAVWCTKVNNSSRAELKKNFEKLKNAMDIINAIDIYKYNFKNEKDETKKNIGLVIGDDFRYSKEVTDEKNASVDLYSLISVCVKAIQEQQEQINQLKAKLNDI